MPSPERYGYAVSDSWNAQQFRYDSDQEAMTYDNPGNSFMGAFVSAAPDGAGGARVVVVGNFSAGTGSGTAGGAGNGYDEVCCAEERRGWRAARWNSSLPPGSTTHHEV